MKTLLLFVLLGNFLPSGPLNISMQATPDPRVVKLVWDSNTESDLSGYRVYWGNASGQYGGAFKATVPAVFPYPPLVEFSTPRLVNGTYFFAVTAYNGLGLESGFSNEVTTSIAVAPDAPRNLTLPEKQLVESMMFWITGLVSSEIEKEKARIK